MVHFFKLESSVRSVLPDSSVLRQKLLENAKIKNVTFWKPEACNQTVLPDRSVLMGRKLVEMPKFKNQNATFWVIFKHYQFNFSFFLQNFYGKSAELVKQFFRTNSADFSPSFQAGLSFCFFLPIVDIFPFGTQWDKTLFFVQKCDFFQFLRNFDDVKIWIIYVKNHFSFLVSF